MEKYLIKKDVFERNLMANRLVVLDVIDKFINRERVVNFDFFDKINDYRYIKINRFAKFFNGKFLDGTYYSTIYHRYGKYHIILCEDGKRKIVKINSNGDVSELDRHTSIKGLEECYKIFVLNGIFPHEKLREIKEIRTKLYNSFGCNKYLVTSKIDNLITYQCVKSFEECDDKIKLNYDVIFHNTTDNRIEHIKGCSTVYNLLDHDTWVNLCKIKPIFSTNDTNLFKNKLSENVLTTVQNKIEKMVNSF